MSGYNRLEIEAGEGQTIPRPYKWFWVVISGVIGAIVVLFPLFWGGRSIMAQGLVSVCAFLGLAVLGIILFLCGKSGVAKQLPFHTSAQRLVFLGFLFSIYLIAQVKILNIPSADAQKVFPFLCWFVVVATYLVFVLVAPLKVFMLRLWLPKQRRRAEDRNLLYRSCETDAVCEWFITTVILSAVISGLVAVLQWVTRGTLLEAFYSDDPSLLIRQGRLHWPFVNPNHLSMLLTVGVILAFLRLLRFLQISKLSMGPDPTLNSRLRFIRSPERLGFHLLYLVIVVFLFVTNILTLSRAGNFIMLVSLYMLYFVYSILPVEVLPKRSKNKLSLILQFIFKPTSFFLICLFVIFLFLGDPDEQRIYERVAYGLTAGYDELRLLLLQSSWRMFVDSWVFGVGGGCWSLMIEQYMTASMAGWNFDYAHNDLIQLFAETGIIGVLFVLAVICLILKDTFKVWKHELIPAERLQIIGGGLAVLAPILHSLVDFPFHLPALAIIFAVVLAAYLRILYRFSKVASA